MTQDGKLVEALVALDETGVATSVAAQLADGVAAGAILEQMQMAMEKIGECFSNGEYYLAELIMAAEIFKHVMAKIEPLLEADRPKPKGTVVVATVKGDVHDLGKNIVVAMLRGNGFEVHDLGVDVDPQVIVDKVAETKAAVLGLSALLTTTYPNMRDVTMLLEEAGLRDSVKVMLGGGPVDERVREFAGADAVGRDGQQAVTLTREFVGV